MNQEKRSSRTKVSLGLKRRSQTNRSSSIYKTWVWFSAISLHTTRSNVWTSTQLHKEVFCWSCWNKGWSVCWRSDYWQWKLWTIGSLKDITIEIFRKTAFKLLKWHSHVPALEGKELVNQTDQTFAKEQLGVKLNETKMLSLSWKKNKDLIAVEIPSEIRKLTNRTVPQKLPSI